MNQRTTQTAVAPGVIDLGVGHPGLDLLPFDLMRAAAAHRLAAGDATLLQYGLEAGSPALRTSLAEFLTGAYGCTVEAGDLFMTNGVSQALDLICTLYTRPGDVVVVEEPTYFLALKIFADHGLRVIGVPVDGDGLIPAALEEALRRWRPRFLYTIPAHQNPSGATLAAARRAQVVALCAEHGCMVVADEVYQLLTYHGEPPPPLAAYAGEPHVLALGSFSKILAPGLRLGWVQAKASQVERLAGCGLLDSGGGLNPFTGALVQGVLESGALATYLSRLREVYTGRLDALARAVRAEMGPAAQFMMPAGGYFLWLALDGAIDMQRLEQAAQAERVGYRAGARFSTVGSFASHLRLCFAHYGEAELEEGVRRLARAVAQAH